MSDQDIVDAIHELKDILEEIRDGLSGGGGGAGLGSVGKKSSTGGGSGLLKGGKSIFSKLKTASNVMDASGISAGLRAGALGATGNQALNMGVRALAQTAVDKMPFSKFLLANTSETLQSQGRAQSSVSAVAERIARAGGSVNREGIQEALKRQNEIEGRVQKARQTVAHEQAGVGAEELQKAFVEDLAGPIKLLVASMNQLNSVMMTMGQTAGGVR